MRMSVYRFESDFHVNGMVKLVATANIITSLFQFIIYRGMVAEVARKAHYLEVVGSSPTSTTLWKIREEKYLSNRVV